MLAPGIQESIESTRAFVDCTAMHKGSKYCATRQ